MSALPPKADIVQHDRDVRYVPEADVTACWLFWSKGRQTKERAAARSMVSFEDFVNGGKQCLRNCQAESGRRLSVDGKLELGRLLNRYIARFCAA
jgi:hypothetical protein